MYPGTAEDAPIRPAPVVEQLDRDTCLALLATQSIGRVAVAPATHPTSFR